MTIEQARQTTQTIEEHNAAMRFAEAESLCMALASDPGIEQWPDLRARILTALSQSYWQRGMTKESLPPAELAWSVASVSQECSDGIKAKAVGNLATCYEILTNYPHALQCYATALSLAEQAGDDALIAGNLGNLGLVYWAIENYPKALEYLHQALAGYELLGNISGTAINAGNLAVIYSSTGEYDKALEYYTISIDLFRQLGNKTSEAAQIGNVGNVYKDVQQYSKAMEYYSQSLAINLEIGNKFGEAINLGNIGNVYAIKGYEGYNPQKAEEYLLKAIAMTEQLDAKWNLYENHKLLSGLYESTHQWEQSLVHFKSYHRLEHDVKSEAAARQAVVIEINRQAAEREKEIELAKVAANAKLQATEELLHNVLPPSIAEKILGGTKLIAEKIPSVSVLFADIVNFTKLSQRITPEELVEGLDRIFSEFDALAEKHGLEKIKTIGDAYMVVSGAPVPRSDHAEAMAHFAFDMVEAMKEFRSISTGEEIQVRIGIHSGEVVAGVIGKKKFAYDLWGDAVNTASRMESHGEAGKIHVSEEFMHALSLSSFQSFCFQERGEMEIKGKGRMQTYFMENA
ncbi:MAG: adenylate/guanylate cyclase domain-containing protein [Candidatus Kapaibacterium sp.]